MLSLRARSSAFSFGSGTVVCTNFLTAFSNEVTLSCGGQRIALIASHATRGTLLDTCLIRALPFSHDDCRTCIPNHCAIQVLPVGKSQTTPFVLSHSAERRCWLEFACGWVFAIHWEVCCWTSNSEKLHREKDGRSYCVGNFFIFIEKCQLFRAC